MRFFFPDSQDQVDPSFDFVKETRAVHRVRQRDDKYAHEVFSQVPYTGILVSMASVLGASGDRSRYTLAQRHRLLRLGVREFFRLDRVKSRGRLESIGDCGAFSYVKQEVPPYSVEEVHDFYADCGFDYGVSIDHVILDYSEEYDTGKEVPEDHIRRQKITLELADEFLRHHKRRKGSYVPVGAAQGWSPKSYSHCVRELQKIGYRYIGLGGMVPLKTKDIIASLEAIQQVKKPETQLHLFGVTRVKEVLNFKDLGVTSFDSTSPLRQAFKDDKDNYYTLDRTYSAIRVPQVESNLSLKRRIAGGTVDQDQARILEEACMKTLIAFDKGEAELEETLSILREYEQLFDGKRDRTEIYREVLEHKAWKNCGCDICEALGIHVIIFRGAERNRRRGFHNVFVFNRRLSREVAKEKKTITREKA